MASHDEGREQAVDHRLTFPRLLCGMSGLSFAPAPVRPGEEGAMFTFVSKRRGVASVKGCCTCGAVVERRRSDVDRLRLRLQRTAFEHNSLHDRDMGSALQPVRTEFSEWLSRMLRIRCLHRNLFV
jgi:hypothetical protein